MTARIAKKLLSADALGLVLLFLALQMLAFGVSSSLLKTETQSLFMICFIAAVAGWVLSGSKLRGIYAALIVVSLGAAGIWIMGARLFLPLLDLVKSLDTLLPQILPALREKTPMDTSQVQAAWDVTVQYSSTLALRWQTWWKGAGDSIRVNDALIQNMIWSLIVWCVGAWMGWFAARRNALLAFLPAIALLAVVISYSEYRIYSLWLLVILMLLLMGIWNYKKHTTQWQRHRVDYSDSIVYDNAQAIVLLLFLIGTISFSTPSVSWRAIRDAFRDRHKNQAAEMLGIRQQSVAPAKTIFQQPSLPREHLLTEGVEESKELVMTIRTGELPPMPDAVLTKTVPRHYWRSTVYDGYMGAGWITNGAVPQNYKANTPIIPGLLDGYRPLHLDVKLYQPEGKLFWSGLLYSASVPFRVDWRMRPQPNLFADQTALLQADMFSAASGARSYEADIYIPQATIEQLRAASTQYPDYIRVRYLALPNRMPQRVRDLAKKITLGVDNPYDKAKAIEGYLRRNYPYDLKVPAPPKGQDVADFFLFDLKRGYCDYYATAMVVLARLNGLPARFVSGYSSGSYDAPNAEYVVRKLNAHSWAEVYFPEIGWIEFEPTASEPEIERIEKEAELSVANPTVSPTEKFIFKLRNTGVIYWVSPFILALLVYVLYVTIFERLWVVSRPPVSAMTYIFRGYYRTGRPLVGKRTQAETASEFTHKLIRKLDEIYSLKKTTRPYQAQAKQLTQTYQTSLFSNHSVDKNEIKKAFEVWKHLRRQILMARFRKSITWGNVNNRADEGQ
jgi:transglutaminase-like putative cysteine protease